jgi:hypothetical protein
VAKRPREKQVTAREQHPEWELLDMAAWETKVSGLQEASIMRGARETYAQEKESATSRRRSKLQVNVAWEFRQLHRAELPTERIPAPFWRGSGPEQMQRWKCTQSRP